MALCDNFQSPQNTTNRARKMKNQKKKNQSPNRCSINKNEKKKNKIQRSPKQNLRIMPNKLIDHPRQHQALRLLSYEQYRTLAGHWICDLIAPRIRVFLLFAQWAGMRALWSHSHALCNFSWIFAIVFAKKVITSFSVASQTLFPSALPLWQNGIAPL